MKKIIAILLFSAAYTVCQAQIPVPKTVSGASGSLTKNFIKPPAIGDIGTTTNGIVDMLGSKLSLPDTQKPKLTDAVSGFLKNKQSITGLADKDPTGYLSKFNPMQSDLFGKMKGIMGAAAFTKFLGLKPSGSSVSSSLLSNLFF
ncbi:MAG TPA: hypothetical protein PLA68_02615 [Panacibacter sp.]|nr:hypothetical protein [Panacibacter sp.]